MWTLLGLLQDLDGMGRCRVQARRDAPNPQLLSLILLFSAFSHELCNRYTLACHQGDLYQHREKEL